MTKNNSKNKTGREFESLIACIQKCVHDKAKIDTNVKIRDIDTGKYRQIDIGIWLTDGPTDFFGIVEVRDRNRPIGVRYVEEISSKCRSVNADAAFIVSRSGFTKTALIKAGHLGLRALTYEEATNSNWSNWLKCKTIVSFRRKYEKATMAFSEFGSESLLEISDKLIQSVNEDKTTKVIKNEDGVPVFSIPDLIKSFVDAFAEQIYADISADGTRHRKTMLAVENQLEPAMFVDNKNGDLRRIGKVKIDVDCYIESEEYPFKLMKYSQSNASESIAEVAMAEIDTGQNSMRVELIATGAGEYIPAGAKISLRTTLIEKDQ